MSALNKENLLKLQGALNGENVIPASSLLEAFTSLECYVNTAKLPIVVVDVKGFIPNAATFHEKVVTLANEAVEHEYSNRRRRGRNKSGTEGQKLRLVLDLRNVCTVSKHTVTEILLQYTAWILDRFERVCVIMPRPHRTRQELACGYRKTIEVWSKATNDVTDAMMGGLDQFNPVYMMANSGAR